MTEIILPMFIDEEIEAQKGWSYLPKFSQLVNSSYTIQIFQEFIPNATFYTTAGVLSDKTARWEMVGKEVHPWGEVTHWGAGEVKQK